MVIKVIPKTSYPDLSSVSKCEVTCLHVKITDFKKIVKSFEKNISNTSWIKKLKSLEQLTFRNNVKKTIEKIVNEIIAKSKNRITTDIGEYIVSYSAQHALKLKHSHSKIPLAELLKEKISGNPGFDFHTICLDDYLIFGEAKFSLTTTPKRKALKQIVDFIDDRDNAELLWLKPFLKPSTITFITNGHRGYTAAFSFNGKNVNSAFTDALKSKIVQKILKHKKLYLIAVEIC